MIVLIGFMGSGKTTVGRLLATRLGLPFYDTDEMVVARSNMPVPEIFATAGEERFRALEEEAAAEALSAGPGVVALGGGALGAPATRSALREHDVVWLRTDEEEVGRRVGGDTSRPLLSDGFGSLLAEREPVYERAATVSVVTDTLRAEQVCGEIVAALGRTQGPHRRVIVRASSATYPVIVGPGAVEEAVEALGGREGRGFVVTERSVKEAADLVASGLTQASVLEIEGGEPAKSLGTVGHLLEEMAHRGAKRRDAVVGVGGGVVCDIAGFVAATYMRGVPLVLVPTSLLAQVDAAIGGKNGVNLSAGKNLAGSILQPRLVACDTDLLASLPEAEWSNGMAEVIKYGLIADSDLLEELAEEPLLQASGPDRISAIVARCAAVKAAYVQMDERDRHVRAHLNYGHTFGHALEAAGGYTELSHGQAVALGMMAAAYLARRLGRIAERQVELHRRLLEGAGLPTRHRVDIDEVMRRMTIDKKADSEIRFVLMIRPGRVEAGVVAPEKEVRASLEELLP